ncbi:MAG: PQQ-binding-like beta-propeller repeat protein [Thermoplasmata archaeon]|nr:PQQ-binding-like beta-propeller repeat protein [Thermoplasmata archaeon]
MDRRRVSPISRGCVSLLVAATLALTAGVGSTLVPAPGSLHAASPRIAGSFTAAGDWTMFLHDLGRSGNAVAEQLLSAASAPTLAPAWSYATGGVIGAQPVIVGGHVFVSSWDGYFYDLNATGGLLWKSFLGIDANKLCSKPPAPPAPRGPSDTATVVGGTVYVGGGDGALYALNASTGNLLWRVPLGNTSAGYYLWSSPLVVGTVLYIGIASSCTHPFVRGAVVEINLKTHTILHRFSLAKPSAPGAGVWGSPTFDAATKDVYVVTGSAVKPVPFNESVVQFNDNRLSLVGKWSIPTSQQVNDSDFGTTPTLITPASGPALVVATNKNGIAYAWNASNVSRGPAWEQRISNGGPSPEDGRGDIAPAAFNGSTLFEGGEDLTVNGKLVPGTVSALNPTNGSILWRENVAGHVLGALTYADGLVLAGAGAMLEVLDSSNGTLLWNATPSQLAGFFGAPSVSNGCIYEGSSDGSLYAWGVSGGICFPPLHGLPGHHPPSARAPASPVRVAVSPLLRPRSERP